MCVSSVQAPWQRVLRACCSESLLLYSQALHLGAQVEHKLNASANASSEESCTALLVLKDSIYKVSSAVQKASIHARFWSSEIGVHNSLYRPAPLARACDRTRPAVLHMQKGCEQIILVVAGTVFLDVLIWKCSNGAAESGCAEQSCPPLFRLRGHKGSIHRCRTALRTYPALTGRR